MSQINTLIKPTHACNMRCKYCFHEKYGYYNELLKMELLKKYIELLSRKYKYINLVWHGGEPLMVPLSYYEEIYDYIKKFDNDFIFSLQTNATLLDQEKIDFFKKNDTNIGISFDGLSNEKTRGNTKRILKSIKLMQENEIYPGAIMVVNQNNVKNLINDYEYFKSLNLGMKVNPMFNDGAAKDNDFFNLNPDEYIRSFIDFFKYWIHDQECNINVSTCEEIVNMVVNNNSGVCTYNSCLGKWLCLDSNACLYPCDRLCIEEYNLGSIVKMNNIDEAFRNEKFLNLLKSSYERRNNCIENCEFFENCYGGCNANANLSKINNDNMSCYIQKQILKELKDYILKTKENSEKLNHHFTKLLIKNQRNKI